MSNNEIIAVTQLPVITEQLRVIKEQVTGRVNDALSLACTEETVQAVKRARADLNAEFKFWEEKRKEVKKAILMPYEAFEVVYKDCVSDVYKTADAELKDKIDGVEKGLKEEKAAEVRAYFDEYLASKNITMPLTFECANINVTLSASRKSLKEQAKAFIDRVCDDLELIETQESKEEIYHEYTTSCFLNVSGAIKAVANRHKAIEEARAREAERVAREQVAKQAVEKVETVAEVLAPPTAIEPAAPVKVRKFSFEVTASDSKIEKLIQFLESENYYYECV